MERMDRRILRGILEQGRIFTRRGNFPRNGKGFIYGMEVEIRQSEVSVVNGVSSHLKNVFARQV